MFQSSAQECGNCKLTPRVANYDCDVQVPKLADTGEAMLQWRQLYWLGKHANAFLYQSNKNCIQFTQPVFVDDKGNETLIVGATHTQLPGSGDLSQSGDYVLTGFVKIAGTQGVLHLELQSACSRKVVTSANVPFNFSSESSYMQGIAQQAASQLSPLIDKIKQFELKERQENSQVALSGFFSEEIKVTPQKRMLKPGEETEFTIEIKDCDGQPLKEMQIEFTKATIGGFTIEGTTGGIVTPSKLMTDAAGKAKGKFKMGTGNLNAMISAHSLVKKPNGCPDAFVGSVEIGTTPHVKVNLDYVLYGTTKMGLVSQTQVDTFQVGVENSSFIRNHRTILYYYPVSGNQDINANIFPTRMPGLPDNSKTVYVVDAGFYNFNNNLSGNSGLDKVSNSGFKESDTSLITAGRARSSSRPEIHFNIIKNKLANFSIEFNYPEEKDKEEAHPGYPSGFVIESDDPGTKFTARKITDPNSRYKMEYKVVISRKIDNSSGEVYKTDGLEELVLTILSTYDGSK